MRKNSNRRRAVKTAVSVLLAILMLCALVACDPGDDVPEGMIEATCAGAPYRLYVLQSWTPKTGSGVSGAYLSLSKLITVSLFDKEIGEDEDAVTVSQAYVNAYRTVYDDCTVVTVSDNAMGGVPAHVTEFTLTKDEVPAHCLQAVSVVGGRAYVFLYTADETYYADYLDQVYEMISFVRMDVDPYAGVLPEAANPDETPAGMICISPETVGFYCFVPATWQRNCTDVPSATAPGDDTNVSAVMYVDETVTDTDAYFALCRKEFARLPGYEVLEQGSTEMGGLPAGYEVFRVTVDGVDYKIQQVVVCGRDAVYGTESFVLTYTSTEALYEKHLADFTAVRDAFVLR